MLSSELGRLILLFDGATTVARSYNKNAYLKHRYIKILNITGYITSGLRYDTCNLLIAGVKACLAVLKDWISSPIDVPSTGESEVVVVEEVVLSVLFESLGASANRTLLDFIAITLLVESFENL